jgi:uncharacterized protein
MPEPAWSFLLAPGAGAPSSSAWMQNLSRRLGGLGKVELFDYPYQLAGRHSPDKPATLIAAHRVALLNVRAESRGAVVLVGKSMGGRIGCHVAVELGEAAPPALVCLGYPLVARGGAMRDGVLLALRTPVLFVQGTRDPLCPLESLKAVRAKMAAPNQLFLVEGGDHSLVVAKSELAARNSTQDEVFESVITAVSSFLQTHLGHRTRSAR